MQVVSQCKGNNYVKTKVFTRMFNTLGGKGGFLETVGLKMECFHGRRPCTTSLHVGCNSSYYYFGVIPAATACMCVTCQGCKTYIFKIVIFLPRVIEHLVMHPRALGFRSCNGKVHRESGSPGRSGELRSAGTMLGSQHSCCRQWERRSPHHRQSKC